MRPKTLAQVAQWTGQGASFDLCLAEFLDEFQVVPDAAAIEEAPVLLATEHGDRGRVQDAYLAATAEELARTRKLPAPAWIRDDRRKLHRPWFASSLASLRAVLLVESPAAFRARNLFVSANALSRVYRHKVPDLAAWLISTDRGVPQPSTVTSHGDQAAVPAAKGSMSPKPCHATKRGWAEELERFR
jgi:hypothetical protein